MRLAQIKTRLTLLYVGLFGFTLILFCSILYKNFRDNQENSFDIALYNHAVDISQGITLDLFGNLSIYPDILLGQEKILPFSTGQVFVRILTLEGIELARSKNFSKNTENLPFPSPRQNLNLLVQSKGIFQTIASPSHKNEKLRVLTTFSPGKTTHHFVIQIAAPYLLDQATADLRRFFWLGIPFTLILSAFGGFLLSQRAFAPIRQMIIKANQIDPSHLSERIPVPQTSDEVQSLAITINSVLERIQHAFESQERFIADASHELKTPLAILRGELDVFKNKPRTPEETAVFTQSAAQELSHLSQLVEDLLILARVDAGSSILVKTDLRLEEIILEVIERLEPIARPKKVKIRFNLVNDPYLFQADSDLIRILVKNLVENAIKYSYDENLVEVLLEFAEKLITLRVTNQGPPISEEILPRIFERFFRGPESSSKTLGAGLGLAIAKKIAEIHQGKILATSSSQDGIVFTVQFAT